MEPLLVITNAEAGSNDQDRLDQALGVLRAAVDVEVCHTTNPGELDGVLHRRGGRRVVVAGGDGSLHAVVAALHRRHELGDTVVGLIPLGTGNDFARGAGIPLEPVEAAALVVSGELRAIDLLVDCLGEIVVNHVHVGAGAQASIEASRFKKYLGRAGYVAGALKASVRPPFVRLRVEVDGEEIVDFARPVLMLAVGNGPSVGGGTRLTPEADPGDGKADVMVSFAVGPLARLGYVWHLRGRRHHARDDVLYMRASTVSISGQGFYCSADGEIYGPERNRSWHIEQGAFRMPMP